MISENYEVEGGYHTQKNIKTGEIIGLPASKILKIKELE